jgi:hypothetical protein
LVATDQLPPLRGLGVLALALDRFGFGPLGRGRVRARARRRPVAGTAPAGSMDWTEMSPRRASSSPWPALSAAFGSSAWPYGGTTTVASPQWISTG